MIIAEKFVMLNMPKTGSSFVRAVLKEVHRYDALPNRIRRALGLANNPPMIELILPMIHREYPPGLAGQHATYQRIPDEHRHKTIVSVVRDPFDRYVSSYLYRWWVKHPHASDESLLEVFPNFPDLSFQEYMEMLNRFGTRNRLGGIIPKTDLGMYTVQFIQFYFRDPDRVLSTIDEEYITQKRYRQDMCQVVFLHQENLGEELYEFLLGLGYPERDSRIALEAERVNVTQRRSEHPGTDAFFSRELVEDILERDRLLFELFPEYRRPVP